MKCSQKEVAILFEYFDIEKSNEIQNKIFVEMLLPTSRESLRKVVAKRIAEDLEWTKDLKYAFRRFFTEVAEAEVKLRMFDTDFTDLPMSFSGTTSEHLTKEELSDFLKKYGKFPT